MGARSGVIQTLDHLFNRITSKPPEIFHLEDQYRQVEANTNYTTSIIFLEIIDGSNR